VRNVMQFMLGSSHTSVHPLGHAIDELTRWFETHPGDAARRTDPRFLNHAVNETLRLHLVGPALYRIAESNVTLASGLEIRAGQRVSVDFELASRDRTIYGDDAGQFNPDRDTRGSAYPYGLAFGTGAHMCQGLPIIVGVEGIDGSIVQVLRLLFEAGIRPDPDRPAVTETGFRHTTYISYPIIFDPAYASEAWPRSNATMAERPTDATT
jgi:hypothetical protein